MTAPFQCELQPPCQPCSNLQDIFLARNRFGKALLGDIRRNGQPWRQRLVFVAECTIKLAQDFGPETSGERRSRQIDDIADALQANASKACDRRRWKPQRGQWQGREQRKLLAAGMACRFAIMCGGPRGAYRAGNGERIAETGVFQPATEIGNQFAFAAVKMSTPADIKQQAVRRIARYQGRVTQTPVGNGLEQGSIGLGIFGDCINAGMHGARLRQCETWRKAQLLGRIIDCCENLGIAALAGDDECSLAFPRIAE